MIDTKIRNEHPMFETSVEATRYANELNEIIREGVSTLFWAA